MLEAEVIVHPELKKIVAEATQALARLDANRLEDLALCCQSLNRALNEDARDESAYERSVTLRAAVARQAREAAGEMAVFSQVLSATRANLKVIGRVRVLELNRFSYSEREAGWNWLEKENEYGDHQLGI